MIVVIYRLQIILSQYFLECNWTTYLTNIVTFEIEVCKIEMLHLILSVNVLCLINK